MTTAVHSANQLDFSTEVFDKIKHVPLLISHVQMDSIFRDFWMITPAIATCGSILAELGLGKDLKSGTTHVLYGDVIKKLYSYYSAGMEPTVELISPSHLKIITHSVRLPLAVNQ